MTNNSESKKFLNVSPNDLLKSLRRRPELELLGMIPDYVVENDTLDKVLDVLDRVASGSLYGVIGEDSLFNQYLSETGNNQHFMVRLRKRELALELILPLLKLIPSFEFKSALEHTPETIDSHIIDIAVFLATDISPKHQSSQFSPTSLAQMDPGERASVIAAAFAAYKESEEAEYRSMSGKTQSS